MARSPVRKARPNKDREEKASNIVVKKEKRSVGNPSKYESHVQPRLDEIYQWLINGYTDYSIADSLGIAHFTLIKYKDKYDELIEIYTRARLERNKLVMNKMFGKATGMIGVAKQEKLTKDGRKVVLKSEIYVPPDVNAADLYLRNNDPDYRSAKSAETSNSLTLNFNITELESKKAELLSDLQKLQAIDIKAIE